MQRPYLVYVGGTDEQEIRSLYLGTDGEKAQALFHEAGQDGNNAVVRFCQFPEHSQIRTPKRDGVPPKPQTSAVRKLKAKMLPAPAEVAPAESDPEADGNDPDEEDTGI